MQRLLWVAAALVAVAACDKKSNKGLPPATDWQAPVAAGGNVGPAPQSGGGGDPHAGVPGAPPLGGGGGANPHAGIPGAPPLGGSEGDDDPGGGDNPHPGGTGGVDVAQLGLPPPDPDRPIDPSQALEGTVTLDKQVGAVPAGAIIFLNARALDPATGQSTGAPMAVEKLVAGDSWPIAFRLTSAQAMIGGTGFSGDVIVTARVDHDGNALTKEPGDLVGTVKAHIPQTGLALTIDQVLP